jgi:predicted nucleotidyltransferase
MNLIEQHRLQLDALCRRYRVRRLDLIGSAARADFDPNTSDLDFVVEFDDFTVANAADRYFGFLAELQDLFDREIDLVVDSAIRNPYFRKVVDGTRQPLYAA